MITIELTDKEAKGFKNYRQHQDAIDVLLAAGVFETRRGSVEIHFDMEGKIGAILGHSTMYKRDQLMVFVPDPAKSG